jgi:hypothetical protein
MAQRGGKRPGAGRKPGKVSAAKRNLAEMAQAYAVVALKTLADIAKSGESEGARVSAATAILDRAYGKPAQSHQHSGPNGGPIPTVDLTNATNEDLDRLEALFGPLAGTSGDDDEGDPRGAEA